MQKFKLPTLESERLRFRQITKNDINLIYRLNQKADVMRYITGKVENLEESKVSLEILVESSTHLSL